MTNLDLFHSTNQVERRRFLNRKSAAYHVESVWGRPCSPSYLAKLAVRGDGPPYRKINGRWIVYEETDLDNWVQSQLGPLVASTSGVA